MTELYTLTILEQVHILTPYFIYGGILFILLVLNTIIMRAIHLKRWRRKEEERLPEIVRRKLNNRDKLITSLRNHIEKQDGVIERFSVVIRSASLHNQKVNEILQMATVNEVVRKKRAG